MNDGGRSTDVVSQMGASNHFMLLWSKALVVSDGEKADSKGDRSGVDTKDE